MSKLRAGLGLLLLLASAALIGIGAVVTDPISTTASAGTNIVVVSSTPTSAFTNSTFTFRDTEMSGHVFRRTVQNVGTVPVLYALGSTVATTNYHGILAGGSATRDGLGSMVDLSLWHGWVTVMSEGSSTGAVVTVEIAR